jgi:hypothetical protein
LKAADFNLLPYNPEDQDALDLSVKTPRGVLLTSPIGIGPYLSCNGRGVDGILEASGINESTRNSTFIEVGPCAPEKSHGAERLLTYKVSKNKEEGGIILNRDKD